MASALETILGRLREHRNEAAFFWEGKEYSYEDFLARVDRWSDQISSWGISSGESIGILGDFSPATASLLFALMRHNTVLVPFARPPPREMPEFIEIAGVDGVISFDAKDSPSFERTHSPKKCELLRKFLETKRPGLVVFSSGSTGKPKGILQDCERLALKFLKPRQSWRTVLFLLFDHLGGFNTLLSSLAYGGTAVCIPSRSPTDVCRAIEQGRATLLPTTPTFLNLLIASGVYRQFDLSSINLITYGTEVMNPITLERTKEIFPHAVLKQTYGLSEVGVLRSQSADDGSVWMKVGGDGFEVQVREGILWIRSEANMVGYLNAPSPFDADGWMCTGDEVELKGEYLRVIGRKSEMINVGGQKVFPAEVETVLLEDSNVREVTVFGVPHPLVGAVPHARVSLHSPEPLDELTSRLRSYALNKLAKYKIPVRFTVIDESKQRSDRFKKIRGGFNEPS